MKLHSREKNILRPAQNYFYPPALSLTDLESSRQTMNLCVLSSVSTRLFLAQFLIVDKTFYYLFHGIAFAIHYHFYQIKYSAVIRYCRQSAKALNLQLLSARRNMFDFVSIHTNRLLTSSDKTPTDKILKYSTLY